ncbi:unnamed protein product [Pleuronectes platessa]|uniref:Uncharacterized protein n=1 Tax=Pleuronectes platessa TaxID=8262 RepID=A0A9N7VDV8_PLEPL|nr:unnamed protein product [Pleuronectes platessa]
MQTVVESRAKAGAELPTVLGDPSVHRSSPDALQTHSASSPPPSHVSVPVTETRPGGFQGMSLLQQGLMGKRRRRPHLETSPPETVNTDGHVPPANMEEEGFMGDDLKTPGPGAVFQVLVSSELQTRRHLYIKLHRFGLTRAAASLAATGSRAADSSAASRRLLYIERPPITAGHQQPPVATETDGD